MMVDLYQALVVVAASAALTFIAGIGVRVRRWHNTAGAYRMER
jgi:hypothetical protein